MTTTRWVHSATELTDGRVIVAGGQDYDLHRFDSAELYDPKTARFSATDSMTTARSGHTATLLSDGRVLIAGGYAADNTVLAAAELYEP
jgi:hypothetical protein